MNPQRLLKRNSFSELDARSRARFLLDPGSMRELLGAFDRIKSPWLEMQGITTQADDGVVVAKGTINGHPSVILAIEGAYQGGSIGEVGGAKFATALNLAAQDNRRGIPTSAVLVLETGGVRLQEANLGLAAIADIHSAIVDLRRYQPVIGIAVGTVGCYGGMSISAGLCSYLIASRETRLGLNGPAVIEQEAGINEFDARDKPFIWRFTGGEQRYLSKLVDAYVPDDTQEILATVASLMSRGLPRRHRSDSYQEFLDCMADINVHEQATPETISWIYRKGFDA